jgi:hypothetical protein
LRGSVVTGAYLMWCQGFKSGLRVLRVHRPQNHSCHPRYECPYPVRVNFLIIDTLAEYQHDVKLKLN